MHLFLILIMSFVSFVWFDVPVAYICDEYSLLKPICRSYTWVSLPLLHLFTSCGGFLLSRFAERLKDFSYILFQYALSIGFIMFVCGILKLVVARARPLLLLEKGVSGFSFGNLDNSFRSFPSSHTAVAVSLMILVTLKFGDRWKWPMIGFIFLIGLSRMILQKHFVSDLLVGALIGVGVTRIVIFLSKKYESILYQMLEVI